MSKYSEKPRGSNPTSPTHPAVLAGALTKGRDLDKSALRAVDAAGCKIKVQQMMCELFWFYIHCDAKMHEEMGRRQ